MPTLLELAETYPEIRPQAEHLSRFTCFQDDEFRASSQGDSGRVLIGRDSVIKIPILGRLSQQRAMASFESWLICELRDARPEPPVPIAGIIDSSTDTRPPYLEVSRIPGKVLSHERVRAFSDEEKEGLGRTIGAFVSWMGDAVSKKTYDEIVEHTHAEIYDRSDAIGLHAMHARYGDYPGGLGKLLLNISREHKERLRDGSLKPTILGHDDLREANMAFGKRAGRWTVNGIFDFGVAKPSTPERELRHVATIGSVALEAAIGEYEARSDTVLSRDLIRFWALTQTATDYAYTLLEGTEKERQSKLRDLDTLLPGWDHKS